MTTDSARPLGEWLRERREERGVSLEQAEAETRIRLCYLEALEAEDFEALPDPVVGRGFLRNYATYLELDPQQAVELYSDLVAPPEPESLAADESSPFASGEFRPVPLHEIPRAQPAKWLLFLAAVVVALVALAALAYWAYPRFQDWPPWERLTALRMLSLPAARATTTPVGASLSTVTRTPTTAAVGEEGTAIPAETEAVAVTKVTEVTEGPGVSATDASLTETPEPTLTITYTPMPTPTPTSSVYTGIFLEMVLTDTSWIQATTDGVRQFQGELEADTYRSFYAEQRIELRVGNAGAVIITINGQKVGTIGAPGEVVDRVFEKVGDTVGEATVTPSPTPEPGSEPTLEPTIPAPTATVSPTITVSPDAPTATANP